MFTTELILNGRLGVVTQDLHDIQRMHQRLMQPFDNVLSLGEGRQAYQLLWRRDPDRDDPHYPRLLVQAAAEPRWGKLPSGYLAQRPRVRNATIVRNVLRPGKPFRFTLIANPRHHVRVPGGTRHRAVRDRDDCRTWLQHHGETGGFRLPDPECLAITPQRPVTGTRHKNGDSMTVTLMPVRYDGHLIVTEPNLFWTTLTVGVGPGKAYGCGLMVITKP